MNPDREAVRAFVSSTQVPFSIQTSPLARALDLVLVEARAHPGRVVLHCEPSPVFLQGAGNLQGGALSAMLDFAMAFAAMPTLGADEAAVTTTLEVAFLRPALAGRYEAVGEILRRGRAIIFARAELRQQEGGELVATGASTLSIVRSR